MLCGARCLQYVHQNHGKRLSLRQAKKLARTTRAGTYAANLIEALRGLNYRNPRLRRNLTWGELKRLVSGGSDVFVSWWSILDSNGIAAPPDGHWSVARKVTRDTITIYDPDPEEELTLPKAMFVANWYDYERDHAGKRDDFIRAAVIARFPKGA